MRALRIRRGVAWANVVLLASLLAFGSLRLWRADETTPAPPWSLPEGWGTLPEPLSSGPDFDLDELLAMVGALTGGLPVPDTVQPPTGLPSSVPGPLPLGLFGLSMYLSNPTGPDLVVLRSKDPAHPISCTLREGEVKDGIRIAEITWAPEALRITISRGTEVAVLERRRVSDDAASCLRRVPVTLGALAARPEGPARGLTDPGLRCVPFYDEQGRGIGLRVTGVNPQGLLATAGLRTGDAILQVDGKAPGDARDFAQRWRTQGAPRELWVKSTEGGSEAARLVRVP